MGKVQNVYQKVTTYNKFEKEDNQWVILTPLRERYNLSNKVSSFDIEHKQWSNFNLLSEYMFFYKDLYYNDVVYLTREFIEELIGNFKERTPEIEGYINERGYDSERANEEIQQIVNDFTELLDLLNEDDIFYYTEK